MTFIYLVLHRIAVFMLGVVQKFLSIPGQVLFAGKGSSEQLARHVVRMGHRNVLVVTDQVLADLGMAGELIDHVEQAGGQATLFSGVLPDPTTDIVEAGVAVYHANNCDGVIALGGGSSIDAAKGIAASATNGPVHGLVGILKIKQAPAPLFAIPTTAGTGSEATFAAVVSDSATHKKGFLVDMKLIPQGVSLDPALMVGMPPAVTAATGVDALTHAIETYIGRWADEQVKRLSGAATQMIFEQLPRAYRDGTDLEAREQMALASYYAGQSINIASVGTVHAIAHQFGGVYGTPHGMANAVTLPYVLDSYVGTHPQALAELGGLVGLAEPGLSDMQVAVKFVAAVRSLLAEVGLEPTLPALQRSDFSQIVDDSFRECLQYPVPRFLPKSEIETILGKIAS